MSYILLHVLTKIWPLRNMLDAIREYLFGSDKVSQDGLSPILTDFAI